MSECVVTRGEFLCHPLFKNVGRLGEARQTKSLHASQLMYDELKLKFGYMGNVNHKELSRPLAPRRQSGLPGRAWRFSMPRFIRYNYCRHCLDHVPYYTVLCYAIVYYARLYYTILVPPCLPTLARGVLAAFCPKRLRQEINVLDIFRILEEKSRVE